LRQRPGPFRWCELMKTVKRVFLIVLVLGFLSFLGGAALLYNIYKDVEGEAKDKIKQGAIESIVYSESPVYYDDGETVLGVFFDKTHRRYIEYKNIPPNFIKALVATEDRTFFTHPGFDVKAIVRAMLANYRAGHIAQGGSTLTQQTAKNIFTRERRSYKAKLKELMEALLLERQYSKEQILEMYVNQFFVTGIGRGLRIAAQYFFDKEAEDLDLVECAFIAGSIKSPNRYNPFTKKTEAERREARRLSRQRKDQVLYNMLEMNYITKQEYEQAKQTDVPFKQGKLGYRLNVILDYIREQLESDYFKAILQEQGVDNIATSGIRVYTSINKEMQEGALRSIRKHLPLLDVKLSGYQDELSTKRYEEFADDLTGKTKTDLPFLCKITAISLDRQNPHLVVSWGEGEETIDYEGLQPIGDAWIKWKSGIWTTFQKSIVPEFLKQLHVGDTVPVQYLPSADPSGRKKLILSEVPELEGGIIVVQKGMVRAMVGGFFDRFFNRATDAKRQLGSIFKPLVYTAALQLNWNTLDPLIDEPDLFRYQSTFYLPKPDHPPGSNRVSMIWAGAKSENLATVWLLYHLTDQLSPAEYNEVIEELGLARRDDETYDQYASRIRDKYGIMVDADSLHEAAFEEAKKEIESDLIFGGDEEAIGALRRLHYNLDTSELDLEIPEEQQIYRRNYTWLKSVNEDMKKRFRILKDLVSLYQGNEDHALEAMIQAELPYFCLQHQEDGDAHVIFTPAPQQTGITACEPLSFDKVFEALPGVSEGDVWLDGLVPSKAIEMIENHSKEIYDKLALKRKYSAEVLYRLSDFRRLVNLLYVTKLSERMGISTKLDPVLSFPLGANSVSILEAALAYETIMTGKVYPLGDKLSTGMVPIITKIVDRQGKTIWEYTPQPQKILSDRDSKLVTDILRAVMDYGTGHSAKAAIRLNVEGGEGKLSVNIPAYGKTGTSNRFTNSSFVGFIPGPNKESGEMGLEDGYVVASYIGYDDNRPMKSRHISIYGSAGALPLWIDTVNRIVNSPNYRKSLQMADLVFGTGSEQPASSDAFVSIPLSPDSGLPVSLGNEPAPRNFPKALTEVDLQDNSWTLKRVFEPSQGVQDAKE
jgi:penicillin-binding protein 1A